MRVILGILPEMPYIEGKPLARGQFIMERFNERTI